MLPEGAKAIGQKQLFYFSPIFYYLGCCEVITIWNDTVLVAMCIDTLVQTQATAAQASADMNRGVGRE